MDCSAPPQPFLDVAFDRSGLAVQYQRGAWSHPEAELTWALWPGCGLSIPAPPDADSAIVFLDVAPAIYAEKHSFRRVQVLVDEIAVLDVELKHRDLLLFQVNRLASRSTIELKFVFDQPGSALDRRPLAIAFHRMYVIPQCERAFSPFTLPKLNEPGAPLLDTLERRTGLPASEMLLNFESLGHTCDFGNFQRTCGADPLGLLRFGGISTPNLLRGLRDRFDRLAEPGSINAIVAEDWGGEYMMTDSRYGMVWHSFLRPGQATPEQLVARETMRLPFLRRMFLETLDGGEKILVLRRPEQTQRLEAEALSAALRLTSRCKLLWAVQEQGGEPGSVDVLSPHLLRGHLDVHGVRGNSSAEAWLSVCGNAYLSIRIDRRDK